MQHLLLVGLGGAVGAIARYLLGGWVLHRTVESAFPWSTFAVNVAGCVIAGMLFGAAERWHLFSEDVRLFLFTGILGGFTTFSAFGLDTIFLLRRGEHAVAIAYIALSILCSIGTMWTIVFLMAPRPSPP